jgi:hypothetical protein
MTISWVDREGDALRKVEPTEEQLKVLERFRVSFDPGLNHVQQERGVGTSDSV